jgi:DNA polymerase bacteriophage-type
LEAGSRLASVGSPFSPCEREGQMDRPHLHIDFETACELNLKMVGLDLYVRHESFRPIWVAYALDHEEPIEVDLSDDETLPDDLLDLLDDPDVLVWAFNAGFERTVLNRHYKLRIPIRRFRCSMALAYMHAFVGGLDEVHGQMRLDEKFAKDAEGNRLMKLFSMPQKITKNQPHRWRNKRTDPVDWRKYGAYCGQDVVAERAQTNELLRFPVPDREWDMWALDQVINDIGIPIDKQYVVNAIHLADKRKKILTDKMRDFTDLANPGSPQQLLPWLKERGYPYDDLRKDTVKITLNRDDDDNDEVELTPLCRKVLKLRQQQARTSVRKYNAILQRLSPDNRIRHILQYGGASRTLRWAGRAMQPQNLPRTPKKLEQLEILLKVSEAIRQGDYDDLELWISEPMDALAGLVRSAIKAQKGKKLVVCDLSSIESRVIGWLTGCVRLLSVFERGLCAYKDFATELYKITYEEVSKAQRTDSKPAVLGCGFRLGGGAMIEGKKTGLWGYAENMGIALSREASHKAVRIFRKSYPEIVQTWYDYENAIAHTIRTGKRTKVGPIRFRYEKPYLTAELPSGRKLWYFEPRVRKAKIKYVDKDGEHKTFEKDSISYMGKQQNGKKWIRIQSHGGKFIENFVQAIARDILREGLIAAADDGFNIVMHVHDEIVCEEDVDDDEHSVGRLRDLMSQELEWCADMPMDAAGYEGEIYRKD